MRKHESPRRFFRAVYRDFADDPLPSRSTRGRFHDEQTHGSTTYVATTERTAWKEVTHRWRAERNSYRMAEILVNLSGVVNLTDTETRKKYGVDEETLTGEDYAACQRLADRLRAEGVEGVLTFSRADRPEGRQLVVFLDLLQKGSFVRVQRVRPIKSSDIE